MSYMQPYDYSAAVVNSRDALVNEIRLTVSQIRAAHCWFDSESDSDLIEACVFQLEALEAKYRYLLRLAKDRGLSCDAITRQTQSIA